MVFSYDDVSGQRVQCVNFSEPCFFNHGLCLAAVQCGLFSQNKVPGGIFFVAFNLKAQYLISL